MRCGFYLTMHSYHTQAALIGVPFPMNSVGRLPHAYLCAADPHKSRLLLLNAEQIGAQLRTKARM